MSTVLSDHKPPAAERYPHLPQPRLSPEPLSHPPPALISSPLGEASATAASTFALGTTVCAAGGGLCSREHPGVERLSPASPSELAEPVADVPCAVGRDGIGGWGAGQMWATMCPPKVLSPAPGSTAASLVQLHLRLSAGTSDPAASERHVLITWFIQAEGDYAASAVTVTDACASHAEGACCGYISTGVSHRRIKSNTEIPVAQLEKGPCGW